MFASSRDKLVSRFRSMVNFAVCGVEEGGQKVALLASLANLASAEELEGQDSRFLWFRVRHNQEDVRVNFLDVSSDRLDMLKYSAFDIDMFLVMVPSKDDGSALRDEHSALLKEIIENFPNTSLVLVDSMKKESTNFLHFPSRTKGPVIMKPKSFNIKSSKGTHLMNVKCDMSNTKEVDSLITSLVKENYVNLDLITRSFDTTLTVEETVKEGDSSVPLLRSNSAFDEQSFEEMSARVLKTRKKGLLVRQDTVFEEPKAALPTSRDSVDMGGGRGGPGSKRRRVGTLGEGYESLQRSPSSSPRHCRNRRESLIYCNCASLRENSDDILLSNQITAMSASCAESYLTPDFISRLREKRMNLSILAVIICHHYSLARLIKIKDLKLEGLYTKLLCVKECIKSGYVGENLLHILARKNRLEKAEGLFQPDLKKFGLQLARMRTPEGFTPVTVAVRWRHKRLASFLIQQVLANSSVEEVEEFLLTRNTYGKNIFNVCCRNNGADLLDLFLVESVPQALVGLALSNPAGHGTQYLSSWGETPLMNRHVPEVVVLKFWPLIVQFGDKGSVLHQRSKGRTYGHIFAGMNYCAALQLYIQAATQHRSCRAIDLLNEVTDKGNSVYISAALHNANEALILCLGHLITEGNLEDKTLVMHRKNTLGQSLLSIILKQKGDLLVPRNMILGIEAEIHNSFSGISKCFRDNLNLQTSAEVHKTLEFMKEYLPEDRPMMIKKKLQIFVESFLAPFIVMMLDIVTDILVVISFGYEVFYHDHDPTCKKAEYSLKYMTRFVYSSTFLLVPWLFYLVEFLRSPLRVSKTALRLKKGNLGLKLCFSIYLVLRNLTLLMFWPITQLLVKVNYTKIIPYNDYFPQFYGRYKYETQKGVAKIAALETCVKAEVSSARAHLIEVAVEATFQPLLQMYLLLPIIVRDIGSFDIDTYKRMDKLQLFSMMTSIISLAWSFAFYKASMKREALDFDVNPLGRIVIILSNLCMITSRLIALVVFAYCFGPGEFLPLLLGLLAHVLLMGLIHLATAPPSSSDVGCHHLLVNCVLNGLANIHTHQWVQLPGTDQANISRQEIVAR